MVPVARSPQPARRRTKIGQDVWEGDEHVACTVQGCRMPTNGGKPWCPAHVLTHAPYPRALHRLELEGESEGQATLAGP